MHLLFYITIIIMFHLRFNYISIFLPLHQLWSRSLQSPRKSLSWLTTSSWSTWRYETSWHVQTQTETHSQFVIRRLGFVPRLVNDGVSLIGTGRGGAKGRSLQPRWRIHSSDSFPGYEGGLVTAHVNTLRDSWSWSYSFLENHSVHSVSNHSV